MDRAELTDAQFAELWGRYIRCEFDSLSSIQDCFGVSLRTARNWQNGAVVPQVKYFVAALRLHQSAWDLLVSDET